MVRQGTGSTCLLRHYHGCRHASTHPQRVHQLVRHVVSDASVEALAVLARWDRASCMCHAGCSGGTITTPYGSISCSSSCVSSGDTCTVSCQTPLVLASNSLVTCANGLLQPTPGSGTASCVVPQGTCLLSPTVAPVHVCSVNITGRVASCSCSRSLQPNACARYLAAIDGCQQQACLLLVMT